MGSGIAQVAARRGTRRISTIHEGRPWTGADEPFAGRSTNWSGRASSPRRIATVISGAHRSRLQPEGAGRLRVGDRSHRRGPRDEEEALCGPGGDRRPMMRCSPRILHRCRSPSIAAACKRPERVIGLHFFNPAPLLPLVEVVPGLATRCATREAQREAHARLGQDACDLQGHARFHREPHRAPLLRRGDPHLRGRPCGHAARSTAR